MRGFILGIVILMAAPSTRLGSSGTDRGNRRRGEPLGRGRKRFKRFQRGRPIVVPNRAGRHARRLRAMRSRMTRRRRRARAASRIPRESRDCHRQ